MTRKYLGTDEKLKSLMSEIFDYLDGEYNSDIPVMRELPDQLPQRVQVFHGATADPDIPGEPCIMGDVLDPDVTEMLYGTYAETDESDAGQSWWDSLREKGDPNA